MEFLSHHSSLPVHLREWSGGHQLIIAECFFWGNGRILQRSLVGLLRSLLYRILEKRKDLIPLAFPGAEWVNCGSKFEFPLKTLQDALNRILHTQQNHNLLFFFLIDGLDEFDDRDEYGRTVRDEEELVEFLRTFRQSAAANLCVSSRPLSSFVHEFGCDPQRCLAIHELTRDDIRVYIKGELEDDPEFRRLSEGHPSYTVLVRELINAANGVFLWVRLASRALARGIKNSDRISDVLQRLEAPLQN